MLKLKQQQIEQPEYSIETVIGILIQAVRAKIKVVKEPAIKKGRQWTHELMASYSYPGTLKKCFSDAIGALRARAKITLHFGISSSDHFWQILKSKNLEAVYYYCLPFDAHQACPIK